MAIGDDLLAGRGGLTGPISFTPDLQAQGIELIPSGGTPPVNRPPIVLTGAQNRKVAGQGRFMEEGISVAGQRRPMLSPEDVRPSNPFDPTEKIIPEDDALTPEGILAPSEIKEQGSALSKLGDFLTNPASGKFLAALGMSLTPSQNDPLGELAIDLAESKAQGQFRKGLESGERPGDILVPGLSTAGRQQVQEQFEYERGRKTEEGIAQSREERLTSQEDRLTGLADLNRRRVEQQLELGEIDKETAALELKALEKAQEFAGSGDINTMVKESAKAIGLDIPEGINLEGLTGEQGFTLVQELAALERVRQQMNNRGLNTQGTDIALLSEGMRRTHIKTAQGQLDRLRNQLRTPELAGSPRTEILRQMREIEDQILELGGDPTEAIEGAGASADPTGIELGVQNIVEFTGLSRATVEAMTPAEKRDILVEMNRQNQ